ncbi:MAG: hypothetical protein HYV09_05585 [Deltaproteobacteria bacterium]|nr:hypothetical protein [Deltaproteobacteria bacterium]
MKLHPILGLGIALAAFFGGVAAAQTIKGAVKPLPPSARVSMVAVPGFRASFSGELAASIRVGGDVNLGDVIFVRPGGQLTVDVSGSTATTLPTGSYRVRFSFSNVSDATTVAVRSGTTTSTCSLVPKLGYQNLQSCDLVVASTGTAFVATATHTSGAPQLAVDSVQVFKN